MLEPSGLTPREARSALPVKSARLLVNQSPVRPPNPVGFELNPRRAISLPIGSSFPLSNRAGLLIELNGLRIFFAKLTDEFRGAMQLGRHNRAPRSRRRPCRRAPL